METIKINFISLTTLLKAFINNLTIIIDNNHNFNIISCKISNSFNYYLAVIMIISIDFIENYY